MKLFFKLASSTCAAFRWSTAVCGRFSLFFNFIVENKWQTHFNKWRSKEIILSDGVFQPFNIVLYLCLTHCVASVFINYLFIYLIYLFIWLLSLALLCFALLCFVLLCFALLCFALLCFALLCFALLCFVLGWFSLFCFGLVWVCFFALAFVIFFLFYLFICSFACVYIFWVWWRWRWGGGGGELKKCLQNWNPTGRIWIQSQSQKSFALPMFIQKPNTSYFLQESLLFYFAVLLHGNPKWWEMICYYHVAYYCNIKYQLFFTYYFLKYFKTSIGADIKILGFRRLQNHKQV